MATMMQYLVRQLNEAMTTAGWSHDQDVLSCGELRLRVTLFGHDHWVVHEMASADIDPGVWSAARDRQTFHRASSTRSAFANPAKPEHAAAVLATEIRKTLAVLTVIDAAARQHLTSQAGLDAARAQTMNDLLGVLPGTKWDDIRGSYAAAPGRIVFVDARGKAEVSTDGGAVTLELLDLPAATASAVLDLVRQHLTR